MTRFRFSITVVVLVRDVAETPLVRHPTARSVAPVAVRVVVVVAIARAPGRLARAVVVVSSVALAAAVAVVPRGAAGSLGAGRGRHRHRAPFSPVARRRRASACAARALSCRLTKRDARIREMHACLSVARARIAPRHSSSRVHDVGGRATHGIDRARGPGERAGGRRGRDDARWVDGDARDCSNARAMPRSTNGEEEDEEARAMEICV